MPSNPQNGGLQTVGLYAGGGRSATVQAGSGEAIDLGSDTLFDEPVCVYVGVSGTVKVDLADLGTGLEFDNAPQGQVLPLQVVKVYSTANGTTATDLIALHNNAEAVTL